MNTDIKDEVVQLHLDDIIPNRFQPREVFDERALKELAVSIREHGVIQPIIVRNVNGKYEIIAGERRYKASALAGLTKIPAIIRDLDDKESSKVALLENLQRKNLNPIEEARTYQKILEIDEMTQEELAKTMGKSQSAVANKIRLLSLPEDIQESLLKEKISERHARALLNVPDEAVQKELIEKVENEKMSVRALEEEIKTRYPKGMTASEIPIAANAMEETQAGMINNQPLAPTVVEEEEKTDNYGKVVIAPPSEEPVDEYANEEEKEEDEEESTDMDSAVNNTETQEEQSSSTVLNIPTVTTQPEPNNVVPSAPSSALDNLLDIKRNVTPEANAQKGEDYFALNDVQDMKVPDAVQPEATTGGVVPIVNTPVANYTEEEAIQKVRDTIEDLKAHGINVSADEMDFPKSYQVILKIDKPE